MKFPLFVAWRYLFSARKRTAVNLISFISLLGIAVGTAALLIVLSVFTGFTQLITGLYGSMDPDISVHPAQGKFLLLDTLPNLDAFENLATTSYILEERALIRNKDKEYVATLKGVDPVFVSQASADGILRTGRFFDEESSSEVILGQGVAYFLSTGINPANPRALEMFLPKNKLGISIQAMDAFERSFVYPVGIFSAQAEYDAEFILMPINAVQEKLDMKNQVSAVQFYLKDPVDAEKLKSELKKVFGPNYIVKDSIEQHAFMYKVMESEKWAIYLIFTFILIIAAFNLIGSVTMLILDKLPEIKTMWSLGATWEQVRNIFWWEGMLLSGLGGGIGLVLGIAICLIQQEFGLLKMGSANAFVVSAYPVSLNLMNVLMVGGTVAIIGVLSALLPVLRLRFHKPFHQAKA